jgi:tripartite-type tricarboxylate transporter receptor subunit TctC
MQRRQFVALGGVTLASITMPLRAQAYPERPIKIVQGFAPGGNADAIARTIGTELSKTLGQSVIVEAKTGAGGTIGSAAVAMAKPDGYTLLLATGGHAVAGALYNTLPYKTVADFEPISTITYFPFLLVVQASSPLRSFKDVLDKARSQPEAISYGTAGVGSTHHLAMELLAKMGKARMLHVPYRGDTASLAGLLTGEVSFIIAPPTAVISNIQAGKLRAIASTGGQRWPGLPDVPTVAEQAIAGYDVRSWAGLLAPVGTPRVIIDRVNADVQKALLVPAVRQRLEDMGGEVRGSTPEEMKAMVTRELDKWVQVVADAKIPKQ